jgi:hypothetical protein
MQIRRWSLVLALTLAPAVAYANFIWPPMLYLLSFSIWWVVVGGLTIEGLTHRFILRQPAGRTIWLAIGTNAVSAIAGTIVLLPVLVDTSLIDWASGFALNIVLIVVVLAIPLVNFAIEFWAGTRIWSLPRTRRTFASFLAANLLSFGLVAYAILFHVKVPL